MPGRRDRWWISPAIPTIADGILALLWVFSAFGGWGDVAFCRSHGSVVDSCSESFDTATTISAVPAVLAFLVTAGAWALPRVRRDADRLDAALIAAALLWVAAMGVLFVGGYLAQP